MSDYPHKNPYVPEPAKPKAAPKKKAAKKKKK